MRAARSYVPVRDLCPYCEYRFTIDARDITGERHALQCIDCRETFVVEISVAVSHKVRGLAGVSMDAVLDRLVDGAHPGKAESGAPAILPVSIEIERPDDAEPGIPVLTDVVLGDRELEDVDISQDEIDAVGRDLDAAAVRVNDLTPNIPGWREAVDPGDPTDDKFRPKPRELTAAEIAELRDLLADPDPESPDEPPADFVDVDPFHWCTECKTRHFCNNRKLCTRQAPARAQSGISTRPGLRGLGDRAPPGRQNGGLKYRDER